MPKKQTKKKDESSADEQAEPNPSDTTTNTAQGEEGEEMPAQTATWADVATNFERLRERANLGDRDAQTTLVKYLNATPALWYKLGEMAWHAEASLVEAIAEGEWLTTQAIRRRAAELRRELSRPSQSPLEELAVQRVVACWVQLQFVDSKCAQADGESPRAKLWLQRQQQAHKLYAAAEKSLLLIRGLMPPAVQLAAAAKVDVSVNTAETNGAEPKEGSNESAETPSASESAMGVNRIAHFADELDQAAHNESVVTPDGRRRINGHDLKGEIACVDP
jgi:hypothetical protein